MSHVFIYILWDLPILNQIKLNHQERSLFQFSTNDSSIILEESEGKSILKHPSSYQVIDSTGEFNEHHFYSAILSLHLKIIVNS